LVIDAVFPNFPGFGVHMKLLGLLMLFWLLPLPIAAQDAGTVTLVEGPLRVIRGVAVFQPGEGVRLRQGDIFETSEKGFAQLEFVGGGIVDLGPASRMYVLRYAAGKIPGGAIGGTELVLLSGWMKGQSNADAGSFQYESPLLAATTANGTVVFHSSAGECDVFVESGSAKIADVSAAGDAGKFSAGNAGQFFSRHAGKSFAGDSRPSAAFLKEMPQAFKDTLPSRLAHFTGKPTEPKAKAQHLVTYAEIQGWLTMPRGWRRGLVARFEPRLKDPEFRKELAAHESEYPEWGPALHPEKKNPDAKSPESAPPTAAANPESPHLRF
jgi:hypothetical protein